PLRFFSAARGVHNTLSRFRVKHLFRFSLSVFITGFHRRTLLTRRLACRCSVSVEAHYRELFRADKGKFKIIFRVFFFSPKPVLTCHKISVLLFLQPQSHFLVAY
ncbi:hypothetical protein ACP3A9_004438, partial [Citrobacter amalonaticus]